MDRSDVILCTSCFMKVKVTEDILLCYSCKLWQHKACTSDVSESFYRDFYISVVNGEKPKQWLCNYCNKNSSQVKSEPEEESDPISTNPQPANQSLTESEYSHYSYDELELSQQIQRDTDDPPPYVSSSLDVTTTTPSRVLQNSSLASDKLSTSHVSRLHNTGYYEDSMLHDSELDITPAALKLPENPLNPSPKELHYGCNTEASTAHGQSSYNNTDVSPSRSPYMSDPHTNPSMCNSDDDMSPLQPPPTPSTIPYCHSDRNLSDSDSEIEFPAPKRVSLAPPPTRVNSTCSQISRVSETRPALSQSNCSSCSSDSEDDRMECRRPAYDSDSDSSSSDVDENRPMRSRPAYRWPSSYDSSSDSEDDSDLKITPPTLTFHLIKSPAGKEQPILQDSHGYTYSVKFRIGVNTFWCCTEKSSRCQATAIQNKHIVSKGAANHNHAAKIPRNTVDKLSPAEELLKINRFQSLRANQDKLSGQPPKPKFEMINTGTTAEKCVLVDSHGFIYHDKEVSAEARQTTWKCTKKTKKGACSGHLRIGDNFMVVKPHNHVGDMKKVTELRVKSKIRDSIEQHPSKTPAQLISHILLELGLTRKALTKAGYQSLTKHAKKQKQTLKCC